MYEFRLPDVGEGIHEAELQEWLVEIGMTVDEGTPVAVINTDKVSVELPSPAAGVVSSLPWGVAPVRPLRTAVELSVTLPDRSERGAGPERHRRHRRTGSGDRWRRRLLASWRWNSVFLWTGQVDRVQAVEFCAAMSLLWPSVW